MPAYVPYRGDYAELSAFLRREYNDATQSRQRYVQMLDEWDRKYEATPRVAERTFPWAGASNLEVPVGATHTDTVVARLESVYFATQPTVVVNSNNERFIPHAAALADYMNQISLVNSGYRREKAIDLLQTVKLGTSFQWLTYETRTKRTINRQGAVVDTVVHEGPAQCTIHPRDLIVPPDVRSLARARWVAFRSYKTWGELIYGAHAGMYDMDATMSLDGRGYTYLRDRQMQRERRQGFTRSTSTIRQWEIVTAYVMYQEKRSSVPLDLWATFHMPSGTILNAYYNPYDHLEWPLSHSVYMFREDAFTGIGIMGMTDMIQEEITMIHNYCLDNLLAANTVVAKIKQGSVADLEISPMSRIDYNGDKDSITFERLGQPLSGQQVGEAAANAYAERRTGVGDSNIPRLGSFQGAAGVRTPATTTLALIGEGNKRFELAIDLSKQSDSALLRQHVMLLRQYWGRLRVFAEAWDVKKSNLIGELFAQDRAVFTHNIVIEVAASTVALNKATEQQNLIQVGNFLREFYAMFLQYLQFMQQAPEAAPIIRRMLNGASELVVRVLRTFDIRDPEKYIPRIDDIGARATSEPQAVVDELSQTFLNGASNGTAASAQAQ